MLTRLPIACLVVIFTTTFSNAQNLQDTPKVAITVDSLKSFYSAMNNSEAVLYNGKFHYGYSPLIAGIPYYESENWQTGSVIFENILYENVLMRYDLVKDQLVVQDKKNSGIGIALYTPRVKAFWYPGNTFYFFEKNHDSTSLAEGFYKEMAKGKVVLYGRFTKFVEETINGLTLERKFQNVNKFYIVKQGAYHEIRTKNNLLSVLKEHKSEIQNLWRSNGIIFKQQPQTAITLAVQLYNQKEN